MTSNVRGLTDATIKQIERRGRDLVVHLDGGVRSRLVRMKGTLTFVDAGAVDSTDLRNAAVERRLEPGWKIDRLSMTGAAATLEVRRDQGWGDAAVVTHQIPCTAVHDHLRPDVIESLQQLVRR